MGDEDCGKAAGSICGSCIERKEEHSGGMSGVWHQPERPATSGSNAPQKANAFVTKAVVRTGSLLKQRLRWKLRCSPYVLRTQRGAAEPFGLF